MKRTSTKHNRFFEVTAVLAMTLASLLFCGSASAASKSATIQVSCTIKPMIEMAGAATAAHANTNLGKQFQMNESFVDRGSQKTHLYSLTAL